MNAGGGRYEVWEHEGTSAVYAVTSEGAHVLCLAERLDIATFTLSGNDVDNAIADLLQKEAVRAGMPGSAPTDPEWMTDEGVIMEALTRRHSFVSPTGRVMVSRDGSVAMCEADLAAVLRDGGDRLALKPHLKVGERIPVNDRLGGRRVLGTLRAYGPWAPANDWNIAATARFATTHDVTGHEVRDLERALKELRDAANPIVAADGTLVHAFCVHESADEAARYDDPWCCYVGFIDLAETQRTIADEATNEPATFSLCGDLANGGELSLNLMHALHYDDDRDMRFLEGLLSAHKGWVVADDDAIMAMGPQHTPHPTVTLHVPADELDSVRDVVASVRAEVGRDAVRGIEDMVATSSYKDVTDLVFDCVPEGSALEENVNRLEASLVRRRIPYRRDSFDASGLMREERTDMADRESSVCEDIRCPRCGDAIETCGTLSLRPDGNVMRTTICAHCGTHVVIDYVLAGIMPMTRTEG